MEAHIPQAADNLLFVCSITQINNSHASQKGTNQELTLYLQLHLTGFYSEVQFLSYSWMDLML